MAGAAQLSAFLLKHPSVKFIRLHHVDLSGILQCRIQTTQHMLGLLAEEKHVGIGARCMLRAAVGSASSLVPHVGLCHLYPDWDSIRICTFAPAHASVMCNIFDAYSDQPCHLCPRKKLADFLSYCNSSFGRTFLIGFEIEFTLLSSSLDPPEDSSFAQITVTTGGLRGVALPLIEEVVGDLQSAGISVQQFHTLKPHHYQISTGPTEPLQAIDKLMFTHECLKHIAAKYGMRATMAPIAVGTHASNGAHQHLSIHPTEGEGSFLAGILDNLETLCSFGMASVDSYIRNSKALQASGSWVSWGVENRGVPVRGICNGHWELRCVDATANFYLFTLVTLFAGIKGIEDRLPLHLSDCTLDPEDMSETQRKAFGIERRMPQNLEASLESLKTSERLDSILGTSLKNHYIAMKEVDIKKMSSWDAETRRKCFTSRY